MKLNSYEIIQVELFDHSCWIHESDYVHEVSRFQLKDAIPVSVRGQMKLSLGRGMRPQKILNITYTTVTD
jgi:hypothetical protein